MQRTLSPSSICSLCAKFIRAWPILKAVFQRSGTSLLIRIHCHRGGGGDLDRALKLLSKKKNWK